MGAASPALVQSIRSASRDMVRELGFMNRHIAGTDLTASQVHALIELERQPGLAAAALTELLRLDKSATSRLLADLAARGLVRSRVDHSDRRARPVALTAAGRAALRRIHGWAEIQVAGAVGRLPGAGSELVAKGLRLYADALRDTRTGAVTDAGRERGAIDIAAGYSPGAIGDVVALHGRYYAKHAGFGAFFELLVAGEMAEFMRRFDRKTDGFWVARYENSVVGSVSIDAAQRAGEGARLRWFIVDAAMQGKGVGRRLIEAALAHCDKMGCRKIYLTTFAGLDAARHLYEQHGFALVSQHRGSHWGGKKLEQRFERLNGST